MKARRNFFRTKKHKDENVTVRPSNRIDMNGDYHICIFSRLFSLMSKTIIGSNAMFHELRNDIRYSIETLPFNQSVVVEIIETEDSTEFARESGTIGFARYMNGLCSSQKSEITHRTAVFCISAVVGILIEILLYGVLYDKGIMPMWAFKSLEVLATLFIWTCGGYFTFEFPGEMKSYKRNKQIRETRFIFRHFD